MFRQDGRVKSAEVGVPAYIVEHRDEIRQRLEDSLGQPRQESPERTAVKAAKTLIKGFETNLRTMSPSSAEATDGLAEENDADA